MRTRALVTAGALMLAGTLITLACSTPSWDGPVEATGTFQQVLRDGHSEGRVPLAGIAETEDGTKDVSLVAVGALEGLAGEVTIVDGDVWLSRVRDGELATERGRGIGGNATMLVRARVAAWSEVPVTHDVPADEVDAFVGAAARDAGLDGSAPFPFRIEGPLTALRAHVISGCCPMHARAEGVEPSPAPIEVAEEAVDGTVVGFYAEGREGELTHQGSSLHAHVLLQGETPITAHVESIGLRAGSVLRLPAR